MRAQNLDKQKLSQLIGGETGSRKIRGAFANELFQESLEGCCLRRSGCDMDPRWQSICKQFAACGVEQDMPTEIAEVLTV